ncbi:homocysteine S-methyltransferase family protein [Celeribacter neptunius]|uniref:Homocysteine S-methyltransferase n=1 Tax=Celeribacter neptunius TaxID=588602 RepID=A0A1I3TI45_9RHOB|nr:homocysteine S-methyltransferase family protein [Celeribacter neptunius]SFJ70173.1 homocysteine S-methyltransferase [Celeribacter neptunius]
MAEVTILDGGLGRELIRFGAELRQPEWSALALLEHPDAVRQAHEAFFRAGAEIATTNSYAVVPFHIGEDRFASDGLRLADLAGRLAREAAENTGTTGGGRVAGCLPPACGSYRPDAFDPKKARDILATLVDGLTPHVDFWLAETMSSLEEARITAKATTGTGKPLWISYSLRDDVADRDPVLLRSGEAVSDATALAVELGAEALLFNCSMPEVMEAAVLEARNTLTERSSTIPIGVYANAFTARGEAGAANETLAGTRDDLSPESYPDWTDRWVTAGATLIGGCCGIGASHIAALKAHYAARSS